LKKKNIILVAVGVAITLTGFSVYRSVHAAYPYSATKTMVTGATILASDINTSNSDHINNNIPESIDDYSANAAEMQTTRDPYPASSISLATVLSEELGNIRHVLQAITQETYWYIDPPTFMENSANFDHGTYDYTTGGKVVIDVDGTAINAAGAITFGAGNDDAIYHNGTNFEIDTATGIDFSISGTPSAVIDSSGNVGIGTSSPSVILDVEGSTPVVDLTNSAAANVANTARFNFNLESDSTERAFGRVQTTSTTITDGSRVGRLDLYASDAGVMGGISVLGNNVGIGTSSPTEPLHVSTTGGLAFRADAGAGDVSVLCESNDTGASIAFSDNGTTSESSSRIQGQSDDIHFFTSNSKAMTIDSSGNVGIGTTSPAYMFDIVTDDGSDAVMRLRSDNSNGDAYIQMLGSAGWAVGVDNSDSDKFKIASSSALDSSTRMTIDSSGNVGIGTTSPDGTLHVHTATSGSVTAHANADDLVVENSAAAGISILGSASDECSIFFGDSGSNSIGAIKWSNQNNDFKFKVNGTEAVLELEAGGDVVLKEDIEPTDDGTGNVGTVARTWADVNSVLINGADICLQNKWRLIEAEDYGYPAGIVFDTNVEWRTPDIIGHDEVGYGDRVFPEGSKPVFAVTKEFIEFNGIRITSRQWARLANILEERQ